ncbi:MAG TPA: YgiT-type zinc finger protein [Ktedonobacterales bacterium]|jgi:YgiT-type zinc finger domain-containing protein
MASLAELLEGIICPRCGREDTYRVRQVEQAIPVNNDVVTVRLTVGECSYCGERLLDDTATQRLQEATRKVRQGALSELTSIGSVYQYTPQN